MRRTFLRCIAVQDALSRPQFDARGPELPPIVARQLAMALASLPPTDADNPSAPSHNSSSSSSQRAPELPPLSNRWIAQQHLARICPSLDLVTLGPAVDVVLPSGSLRYYNSAVLPAACQTGLALSVMRCGFTGVAFTGPTQELLRSTALSKGYASPYWVKAHSMQAFGTTARPGETGVPIPMTGGRHLRYERRALPETAAFDTNDLFNAAQTCHPERFTAATCQRQRFVSITGEPVRDADAVFIRQHIAVSAATAQRPPLTDTVWSSRQELRAFNVAVLPAHDVAAADGSAALCAGVAGGSTAESDDGVVDPCVFVSRGRLVVLFGESMTADPALVLRLSNRSSAAAAAGDAGGTAEDAAEASPAAAPDPVLSDAGREDEQGEEPGHDANPLAEATMREGAEQ